MVETDILRQCFQEGKLVDLHYEFTEVENLKNPNVKRIFNAITKTYEKGKIPDLVKMYQFLPKETRQQDIGFCMELMCENDRQTHRTPSVGIHFKKMPKMGFGEIIDRFGGMTLPEALEAREKLHTETGE